MNTWNSDQVKTIMRNINAIHRWSNQAKSMSQNSRKQRSARTCISCSITQDDHLIIWALTRTNEWLVPAGYIGWLMIIYALKTNSHSNLTPGNGHGKCIQNYNEFFCFQCFWVRESIPTSHKCVTFTDDTNKKIIFLGQTQPKLVKVTHNITWPWVSRSSVKVMHSWLVGMNFLIQKTLETKKIHRSRTNTATASKGTYNITWPCVSRSSMKVTHLWLVGRIPWPKKH